MLCYVFLFDLFLFSFEFDTFVLCVCVCVSAVILFELSQLKDKKSPVFSIVGVELRIIICCDFTMCCEYLVRIRSFVK